MANVIFRVGTQAQYNALTAKDANTLYWLSDVLELRKGDVLYGKGANATSEATGLMSAEDKAALDKLAASGILGLQAVDGSITLTTGDDGVSIGVGISAEDGNILKLKDDGLFAEVGTVSIENVSGLEERLAGIEKTTAELSPVATAALDSEQFAIEDGTLHIVGVDSGLVAYNGQPLDTAMQALFQARRYAVTNGLFDDTLVNYYDREIRVMFTENTAWVKQDVGANGDANKYYMGFRAYAPSGATGFKEDLAKSISDDTLYSFEGNEFAGTDEFGRKYSVVWLPVAKYDEDSASWSYYGANSSSDKYVGWYYSVEWYDADGKVIGADTIRINLSNEDCHTYAQPYYMHEYAKATDVQGVLVWQDI